MAQTSGQDKAIATLNQINSIVELNPNDYSLVIMSAFVFHQQRIPCNYLLTVDMITCTSGDKFHRWTDLTDGRSGL